MRVPLCLLSSAEGWMQDNLESDSITLAAGSLNFREANRTPSVCALVERPHHWLAPGFWEQKIK